MQRYLEWVGDVAVHINPRHRIAKEDVASFRTNPVIYFEKEEPYLPVDLNTFLKNLRSQATEELIKKWNPPNVGRAEKKRAEVTACVTNRPYVNAVTGRVFIEEVRFAGDVYWREEQVPTESHALFRYGESAPIAGASVFEMPGWGLCGFLLSKTDRTMRFINIPVSQRNMTRIFRHRISKT